MDDIYWIALSLVKGVGPLRFKRLIEKFSSPRSVFEADEDALREVIPEDVVIGIKNKHTMKKAENIFWQCSKAGISVLSFSSPTYPDMLRHIPDPPPVLYLKGEIPAGFSIAVVGTRRPTLYGKRVASKIGEVIAMNGGIVVSGMAYGIDAVVHRTAMKCGGETVAVLGSGIDVPYPSEHTALYRDIIKNGAVISEYPPGDPPSQSNFPKRNRIISGLSRAVVVIEGGVKSGALITARCALEQGRDVYAVPGNITSSLSKGTNLLIKEGAMPITDPADVIEIMGGGVVRERKEALSQEEEEIISLLDEGPLSVDEIMEKTSIEVSRLYSILTSIELKGCIQKTERGYVKV